MSSPRNGQRLSDKRSEVVFSGALLTPGERVDILIRNREKKTWEPITSVTAGTVGQDDVAGTRWYGWQTTLRLPADSKYWTWLGNEDVRADVKAVSGGAELTTFDVGADNCISSNQNQGYVAVMNRCASKSSPAVTLTAGCGGQDQSCCLYSQCKRGFVCGKDDTCFGTPAFYVPPPTPVSFTPIDDYPSQLAKNWRLHPQGVATDDQYWYIVGDTNWIGFSSLTSDLNQDLPQIHLNKLSQWGHYGDPDVYRGRIYIPVENGPGGHAVASIDTAELRTLGADAPVRIANVPGGHAAWVAINPLNRRMYLAHDYDWVQNVDEYAFTDDASGLTLTRLREIPLTGLPNGSLNLVQGGAFGPDGTLYLVSSDKDEDRGGVHLFDKNGKWFYRIHVDFSSTNFEFLEGLTVADLNKKPYPYEKDYHNISGDVHVLMIRWPPIGANRVYFKHYKANY